MLSALLLLLFPLVFLLLFAAVIYRLVQGMKSFSEMTLAFPRLFLWSLAVAILGYNVFAYRVQSGIGLGLFGIAIVVAIVLSIDRARRSGAVMALATVGACAGLAFGFRANEFVQGVNAAALFLCIVALLLVRATDAVQWHGFWFVRAAWDVAVRTLIHVLVWLRTVTQIRNPRHPVLIRTVKTVILTLVVLFFFTYLLSSADPVFDQLVARVREEAFQRIVVSLFVAGVLSLLLTFKVNARADDAPPQLAFLGFSEVFVPTVSLAVLFVFFLFVQAKYLFGSHADFQSLHITYADYVRKGFIELLVAAAFGSLLSYFLVLKQRVLPEPSHALGLRVANGIVIVELFALLLSALKRDTMYMEMYGLTRVRLVGEIFLAWLAGMLLLLLIFNLWQRAKEKLFLVGSFTLCAATLVYVNAVNLDQKIVAATPPRGQTKDFAYIAQLSPDAVNGWQQAMADAQRIYNQAVENGSLQGADTNTFVVAKIASSIILKNMGRVGHRYDDDGYAPIALDFDLPEFNWQNYNWGERHAYAALQTDLPTLRCLRDGFRAFQIEHGIDLYAEESELIYGNRSPFIAGSQYNPESLDQLRRENWDGKFPDKKAPICP